MNPLLNLSRRAFDGADVGFQTAPGGLPWLHQHIEELQKTDVTLPFKRAQGAQSAQGSPDAQGSKGAQGALLVLLAALLFPMLAILLKRFAEAVAAM